MDADIVLSQETRPIKNGTAVTGYYYQTMDRYADNKPSILDIQYKYHNKWTSIHYYTGGASFDGGTYVGEVDGGEA
jgi:hypothetical protein